MSNFGVTHLRVVNPYEVAFREAKSAVGASALLAAAEEYKSVADAVADCTLVVGTTAGRDRELHHPLRVLYEGAPLIRQELLCSPVALLFGSEKRGLSNDDLSYCHWLMSIPTRDEHSSMNLGQAVAGCLYELVRNNHALSAADDGQLAAAEDVDRITGVLTESLRASGYLQRRPLADSDQKIRRLVRRLHLRAEDVEAWLGILRQFLWKMRHTE
jgi:tRNA/rRNA methyltransferase